MAYQNPLRDGQDIRDRTFRFACRIVRLSRTLLEEAKAAESRRDFISKCSIGLKEAREAHVRLRIQCETDIGPVDETRTLMTEAHEISCILAAIIRNTKMSQIAKAATSVLVTLLAVSWMLWKR